MDWFGVFKRAYESGYLATETKSAEIRLNDAVIKGLITEQQKQEILNNY